jgi:hypothetical protein
MTKKESILSPVRVKGEDMFNFGDKVKDIVSGFEGIVVGKTEWMNGCIRYSLQGPVKDGKIPEMEWVDEQQLTLCKGAVPASRKLKGGPMPSPKAFSGVPR